MRVSLPSLAARLKQEFSPLYLLFGAEPLLIEEALDQIRAAAKAQDFLERVRYHVEPGFDWNQIVQQGQSISLFAERRLIELRLPTGKPGDTGAKTLIAMSESPSPETTLVVVAGNIDKRSQNTKWFKAIEGAGTITECPAVAVNKLPDWICHRMSSQGLSYDMQAVERLSQMVEGNLLAAAQEINLLALLFPGQKITLQMVDHTIADHARFNVYHLADACLGGATNRAVRILQSLKREQAEPVIILWALSRDIRTVCQLSAAAEKGERPQSLFQKYGVWSSRSGLVNNALKRVSHIQWQNLLKSVGRVDMMVKGSTPLQRKDIWEEIENISLKMCGLRIP